MDWWWLHCCWLLSVAFFHSTDFHKGLDSLLNWLAVHSDIPDLDKKKVIPMVKFRLFESIFMLVNCAKFLSQKAFQEYGIDHLLDRK